MKLLVLETSIIIIFTIGYTLIAFEHAVKINKTATALITGILCWSMLALSPLSFQEYLSSLGLFSTPSDFYPFLGNELSHHLGAIASILFFLIGAMTIVELVDAHDGFSFITDFIKTKDVRLLLWIVSWIAFFLSAVLDNLTTAIVMVSLIRKVIPLRDTRMFFAGMIIIAANAGGAWSPIGDVTTTMLWIGGQISAWAITRELLGPSIVCLLAPLIFLSFSMKGKIEGFEAENHGNKAGSKTMFLVGFGTLIFVPVFKMITHLPPYMGMMLGLGVIWVVSELINPAADEHERNRYTASGALSRIDIPSVLFFLGILLAVAALETMMTLDHFAEFLQQTFGDERIIVTVIGVISAIVDNVPLVAASMGMYSLDTYPLDHRLWHYLAYCAGTGGSLLLVGSAAGVAVMGMEKIDFMWYLKRITLLAFLGYAAGAVSFLFF